MITKEQESPGSSQKKKDTGVFFIFFWIIAVVAAIVIYGYLNKKSYIDSPVTSVTPPVAPSSTASPSGGNTDPPPKLSSDYSSNWTYSDPKDEMTGKTINLAMNTSLNTVNFDPPYEGEQHALLMLRKHPRRGLSVILRIDRGQFLCGVWECSVSVRFDDSSPQRFSAAEPADHDTTMLFINSEQKFIAALKKAKKVKIEASFYQEGLRVFEFDVAGIKW